MKKFLIVLGFELSNYFKKKSFVISTIIISLVMIIVLSIPTFIDCSKLIPGLGGKSQQTEEKIQNIKDKDKYAILDEKNIIKDKEILKVIIPNSDWDIVQSKDEMKNLVKDGVVKAGFAVDSLTNYSYFVNNTRFSDTTQKSFEAFLSELNRQDAITKAGLDYEQINTIYNAKVESDVNILGKDSASNYFYAYVLIFIIYMMILMYGQLIAMSVTSEKSNRAIEVLVTSTSSNSLIFGKVIAGAIASIAQVGIIMISGILGYKLNGEAWNGLLDGVFKIPTNLLVTFALFGIIGYLFYSFMFGALGALVSKTEDIGSSVTPVMLIFIAVFLISMFGLTQSDSMLIKVCSFIPFSSPMTMIVRVAMGTVSTFEVVISFAILVVSAIVTGIFASKIYRMATLMYGNPIKLKNAFKLLKKNNQI